MRHPRAFYWRLLFPLQSFLLCAYAAPLYGFNALLAPIDHVFAHAGYTAWVGATSGGIMLMATGFGGLFNGWLAKLAGGNSRLLVALAVSAPICFALMVFSLQLESVPLLFTFSALTGVTFSNIYTICSSKLMTWAHQQGRAGLQAGMIGLGFGAWGALNSFVAPPLIEAFSLSALLIGEGLLLLILTLLAWLLLTDPPPQPKQDEATEDAPEIGLGQLFKLAPFWIFFAFFFLFLLPGFGFKIIVQALSLKVFHASQEAAQLMAVAFLLSYGLSRLGFGILSDKLPTRPMYFWFTALQGLGLLAMAITLPMVDSIAIFTLLMCFVSVNFAAGKCIFLVALIHLFGQRNFPLALRATLPAYGLAGLLGACSLNTALLHGNPVEQTANWLYWMSGGLGACFILMLLLKRVDYLRLLAGRQQPFGFQFRGDETTKF